MKTRPNFINRLDWELLLEKYKTEKKLTKVINLVKNDYPVQYLIGDVQFLNNKILVNKNVLIPRFETELLVVKLTEYIKENFPGKINIIDLCTGSGCIAVSLKKEFKNSSVTAIDKSYRALKVARKNAKLNNVDIKYLKNDVLKDIKHENKYHVLVSNPPYVKLEEKVSENTKYEPAIALYPGEDDILFYKKILDNSKSLLYYKNIIAFEIGSTQASSICKYAKKIYPKSSIKVEQDYNLLDRFIFIFNNIE